MDDVENPRPTRALLVVIAMVGVTGLGLLALTAVAVHLALGVVLVLAGAVGLARLRAASS